MTIVTSYHDIAFDHASREQAVARVVAALSQFPSSVGIVCTGLSGILIGVPAADRLRREFAIVRKECDSLHACQQVEGYRFTEYVIVDDFIHSGDTLRRIIDTMQHSDLKGVCKGILLYDSKFYGRNDFTHKGQTFPVIKCS